MPTEDDIKNGMTFEELLASGTDSSDTYTSLLTDLVDQLEFVTSPGVDSEVNTLIEQLVNSNNEQEQHLIANALCDKLSQFTESLDDAIGDDLSAQQVERAKLSNLNIAASLIPPETIKNTQLFDTIATPAFKKIVETNGQV